MQAHHVFSINSLAVGAKGPTASHELTKKLQQNRSRQINKLLTQVEPLHQTKVKSFPNDREADNEEQYSLQLYS